MPIGCFVVFTFLLCPYFYLEAFLNARFVYWRATEVVDDDDIDAMSTTNNKQQQTATCGLYSYL